MDFITEMASQDKINERRKITLDSFIDIIYTYGTLDQAILDLDDDMLQFYSDNFKVIDKLLIKHKLVEDYASPETPGYLGWARAKDDKIKNIKYKGNIISLQWDTELATWQPTVRFRSVTESLKYGKMLVDQWKLQ